MLVALSSPALSITQSPLRSLYPANPAPTFIIHTFMKKNIMLITMNIVALSIVNPNASPIGALLIFIFASLHICCVSFIGNSV